MIRQDHPPHQLIRLSTRSDRTEDVLNTAASNGCRNGAGAAAPAMRRPTQPAELMPREMANDRCTSLDQEHIRKMAYTIDMLAGRSLGFVASPAAAGPSSEHHARRAGPREHGRQAARSKRDRPERARKPKGRLSHARAAARRRA
jgi:hypothetical protein